MKKTRRKYPDGWWVKTVPLEAVKDDTGRVKDVVRHYLWYRGRSQGENRDGEEGKRQMDAFAAFLNSRGANPDKRKIHADLASFPKQWTKRGTTEMFGQEELEACDRRTKKVFRNTKS